MYRGRKRCGFRGDVAVVSIGCTHGGNESAGFVFFAEEARDAFLEGNGLGERIVSDWARIGTEY